MNLDDTLLKQVQSGSSVSFSLDPTMSNLLRVEIVSDTESATHSVCPDVPGAAFLALKAAIKGMD